MRKIKFVLIALFTFCYSIQGYAQQALQAGESDKNLGKKDVAEEKPLEDFEEVKPVEPSATTEYYVSWGYNKDFWQNSDISISQGALGNDFTIHNVQASDFPQWNTGGLIFDKDLFTPQFNFRFGRFFDDEKTWALEFSFDHTKYNTNIGQYAQVTGTINGATVNSTQQLTSSYFQYNLHNGANHIMLSLVKRIPLIGKTNETFSLAFLGKVGAGILLPHADNTVLGEHNDVGSKSFDNMVGIKNGWWRFGGWTTGIEAGFRYMVKNPVYLELTDKEAYADVMNIPVYQGTATQNLWMNEIIFSIGVTLYGER